MKSHEEILKENEILNREVSFLRERVLLLEETVKLFNIKGFCPKSEKISEDQLYLFNEAEVKSDKEPEFVSEETIVIPAHERVRGKRKPLSPVFPRVDILIDLKDEEKFCPITKRPFEKIGEEISEQLDVVPAVVKVLRYVRPKYKTPDGKILIAEMPPLAIPKSNAGPGLLAHLITGKYVDHLPLYRQEAILNRMGMELERATTSRWMIQVANLFKPIYNLLHEDLLNSHYLHCDETPVQVLKEVGRKAKDKSYMWVLALGGLSKNRIIFYRYEPSRSGAIAKELLGDFTGVIQTDGYKAYNCFNKNEEVKHIVCLAHVRRKFDEALKGVNPKKWKETVAFEGFDLIRQIYKIQSEECDGKSAEEVLKIKQVKMKPIVENLRNYIDKSLPLVPPKSLTGKALNYTNSLWNKIVPIFEDGNLSLDNNRVENAIRPFAVGKKNWLFSCTPQGADASAIFYSLIETAKACGHEPFFYIRHLVVEAPKAKNAEDFVKLLPYNLEPIKN